MSFDIPAYRFDLTPFVGEFNAGGEHTVSPKHAEPAFNITSYTICASKSPRAGDLQKGRLVLSIMKVAPRLAQASPLLSRPWVHEADRESCAVVLCSSRSACRC
jgi:hypothetical protein